TLNVVSAGCQRFNLAGSRLDPFEIRRPVFSDIDVNPGVVLPPKRPPRPPASRCPLIAANSTPDIEVITCGQVLCRRSCLVVRNEQIGLGVRLHRFMACRPGERDSLAVIAECVISHTTIEAQDFSLV